MRFSWAVGYCQLWIMGQRAFTILKNLLVSVLALALPSTAKPFTLYMDEARGIV